MNEDNKYINIKYVAEAKGLTSTRSLRLELNKIESKYISREIKVNGGTSYEILFSSLEPEIQRKLREAENKTTALVPHNYKEPDFVSDKTKLTANYRANIVVALQKLRKKYPTKKEADTTFLELYNSGLYLPKAYNFIGSISIGTLHRWVRAFEKHESTECLQPKYKWSKQGEYNSILNDEMRNILLTLLLHPSKYNYGKAIKLTKEILRKRGYEELPCDLSFKRFAENFRKNNYAEWILRREGMKAYHDKVEPYIERDISKIEVGDILVADGHVLNFQVINPFTGRPTRATLVGFLDWKSTALVGYEVMMTESTQCIASALRNSIINLGMLPKVVYQDNGKAFKSRFFQNTDFEEDLFNGVYANLNIHSVFAKPYNARAKVIERFFREFQEEFEKGMPSYIGTCIEDKPAWLKRGEKLHEEWHKKLTNNHIPTVQETIKYINGWIKFHNKNLCPNNRSKTIQEMLDSVQKQNINPQVLDDLMMKTECRTINRHGITFLNMHYRSEAIIGIRDKVNIRYSLFDLSKIHVYSTKGEFLCVAHRVQKVHPMAGVLGTVKEMEEYKYQYQKQQQLKHRLIKQVKKTFPKEEIQLLEIEAEPVLEIEELEQQIEEKPKKERKRTPREQQMNRPFFNSNYEKFEWLMSNGTTNQEDRKWLVSYMKSDEYINMYGD
jgi:putative transposase